MFALISFDRECTWIVRLVTVLCTRLPLPPEVLLYLGPHGRHQVVEVHDHMDAHIQEATEGGVSAADKPDRAELIP